MEFSLFVYTASVIIIGASLFFSIRFWIKRIERRRLRAVDETGSIEAVKTKAPIKKNLKKQKENIQENIESRFTVIKRTFYLLFICLWVLFIIFPFLNRMSAAYISVIGTVIAVVIGIAARPFISNMIAGIVITLSRQLHAGDTVSVDGNYGTVEDISLSYTVIKLWNWKRYIIPNSKMLDKEVLNYKTKDSMIWTHVDFWTAHETDIELLEKLCIEIASESPYFIGEPQPEFWVMDMDKESYKCWIAGWTKSPSDCWYFKSDVRKRLIKKLKEHNIRPHFYFWGNGQKHVMENGMDD